jgi:hypothetical protein
MKLRDNMVVVFDWLQKKKLTGSAVEFWKVSQSNIGETGVAETYALQSANGALLRNLESMVQREIKKDEWKAMRETNTAAFTETIINLKSKIIDEALSRPKTILVKVQQVPPDAMAFYRPFHYAPYEEWGIYFVLPKFLPYLELITGALAGAYSLFRREVVATMVMFEIFHHEYYHHLVESTAFTLETIFAEIGNSKPVYLTYGKRKSSEEAKAYNPHCPLEEALANAYAYNSISFAHYTRQAFDSAVMKAYQSFLRTYWKLEPPGYRDAECYTGNGTVDGNTSLLKIMMRSDKESNLAAMSTLVSRVMPSGFTSMVPKPEIPTYFLGSKADFDQLMETIPNPKAAYAYLEFPFMTDQISKAIKEEKDRRAAAKKPLKGK